MWLVSEQQDCQRFICKIHSFSDVLCNLKGVSVLKISETVYKCVANTNTTAHGQKKMNTQIKLDMKKIREFVADFNKFFEELKAWTNDAEQIRTRRERFLEKHPEIFRDFSENEVEMDIEVAATMETESKPAIDRERKLRKVEEKLSSKRTNEKFTGYEGAMSDPDITPTQKIINL